MNVDNRDYLKNYPFLNGSLNITKNYLIFLLNVSHHSFLQVTESKYSFL